jgi:hypothetical protein
VLCLECELAYPDGFATDVVRPSEFLRRVFHSIFEAERRNDFSSAQRLSRKASPLTLGPSLQLRLGPGEWFSSANALIWIKRLGRAPTYVTRCPICQLARRSHIELFIATDGKAIGLEAGDGCAEAAAIQGCAVHPAIVFQCEIFGNRNMERSGRGRIAAALGLDPAKQLQGVLA